MLKITLKGSILLSGNSVAQVFKKVEYKTAR